MNTKRTKRLYCPTMTDSLISYSHELSCPIPVKKRKINLSKVEDIMTVENQASKLLNIKVLKENSDLNFSFVNNSANNSFMSSSVSSLTKDLNKIKIEKPKNINTTRRPPADIKKSNLSQIIDKEKILTKTLQRNFSLSELNTQTRSNFKNIFQDIIKNENQLNMKRSFTSNKINPSFTSTSSGNSKILKNNLKCENKQIFPENQENLKHFPTIKVIKYFFLFCSC